MKNRRKSKWLTVLLESSAIIASRLKAKSLADLTADLQLQDGVTRRLAIVAEAARHLTPRTREKYPEIPWDDLVTFRKMQTHDYWNVKPLVVWRLTKRAIPVILRSFGDL